MARYDVLVRRKYEGQVPESRFGDDGSLEFDGIFLGAWKAGTHKFASFEEDSSILKVLYNMSLSPDSVKALRDRKRRIDVSRRAMEDMPEVSAKGRKVWREVEAKEEPMKMEGL